MGVKKERFTADGCMEYINEKYGSGFTYLEPYDEFQPTASSLKIYAKHRDYPEQKILVTAMRRDDGGIRYLDNFVAVKYEADIQQKLAATAEAVYGECRVVYHADDQRVLSESFGADMSLEAYMLNTEADINALLLLPPSHSDAQKDQELDALLEQLKQNQIIARFAIYYVTDTGVYESMQSSYDQNGTEWYSAAGTLSVSASFEAEVRRWR